jgi:chaperonin GroEL (HSP60 family)
LKKIARTSITGKFAEASREFLSEIAVKAVTGIAETGHDGHKVVDIDNIDVVKKVGGRIEDTELVQGIVIDKEVLHSGMPTKVEDAKIALISISLDVKKTEMSAELKITTSDQLKGFLDEGT